ncbi:MAG: hypothetical protein AB7S38_42295 [Vulcanimicrobiota bacterium]
MERWAGVVAGLLAGVVALCFHSVTFEDDHVSFLVLSPPTVGFRQVVDPGRAPVWWVSRHYIILLEKT